MKKAYLARLLLVVILLINLFSPTFAQDSTGTFKEKLILAFTKKAQIAALNLKVDSLNSVISQRNQTIDEAEIEKKRLEKEIDDTKHQLNITCQENSSCESELQKFKTNFESLTKTNELYKADLIKQRSEDSLLYFSLIQKLTSEDTYLIDSIKSLQATRAIRQEPVMIENYYFKDFKTTITGIPDSKNRITWTFDLFQKGEQEYKKTSNVNLFNEKKQELLDTINYQIKKEFELFYKADPKCFKTKTPPVFTFDQMGIEFQDQKMLFYVVFDFVSERCKYLYGYTSVELSEDELRPYLK